MAESRGSGPRREPEEPVNATRAQIYARLMDAQEQIAARLYQRGVTNQVVQDALDAVDDGLSETERREDLYLAALERYIAALGGRLEVRAVFDGEEILLRQESAP
jgi:Mg-chelatase subunit ChlI